MDITALIPQPKNMVEILTARLLSTPVKPENKKRIENLSKQLHFAHLHQKARAAKLN